MDIVSIIIPTKNGERTIGKAIEMWKKQKGNFYIEFIIIDSGSSDNTINILKKKQVKIISIPPYNFNHGLTRNYGISKSKGNFILLTVQDAIPVNDMVISNLLKHFKDDPLLIAVTGKQIVPQNKKTNPLEWSDCKKKFFTRHYHINQFDSLSPKEKYSISHWDNVISLYKREALELLPFEKTNFGEDMIWAYQALKKGWKLGYDYDACLYHYHHYTFKRAFKRSLLSFAIADYYFKFSRKYPLFLKVYLAIIYKTIKGKHNFIWILYNFKIWTAKYLSSIYFKLIKIFYKKFSSFILNNIKC